MTSMISRVAVTLIAATMLATAASPLLAQRSPRQQQADVIVVDRDQNPVTDLGPTDFVVREDGVAREVISVTPGPPPSPIMLLVDNSQASEPALLDMRRGLGAFVDALADHEVQIGLRTFGERPTKVSDPTSPGMVRLGIDRLFHRAGSGAHMLEAIVETARELEKAGTAGAAIVVFVIESGPEFSQDDRPRVVSALKAARATLWTVVLQSRGGGPTSPEARERAAVIGDVTAESGGLNLPILSSQSIPQAFERLRTLLVARQRITYGRPDTLVPPERLEVASGREGLRVLAPHWASGQ
ncbi:MAG TPA: hypothetical protein VMM93_09390 [Vicinamibacterales bacterium]|nr:hypothetical protein [Vicinamibacterales bacterium]